MHQHLTLRSRYRNVPASNSSKINAVAYLILF